MLRILDCDVTKEIRRTQRETVLYTEEHLICTEITSVKQLLERSCREPAGQYNVTGVWLWTLNNFICSEYCLRTAGFVQRHNSTPTRHLAVKVAARHFKYCFRVFNQIVKQVLPSLLINWAVSSYKNQGNNLFISEETGSCSFFALA